MATLNVSASIGNVGNGTFVTRVELLNSDGAVIAQSQSSPVIVTGNPIPTVGAPTVTVA